MSSCFCTSSLSLTLKVPRVSWSWLPAVRWGGQATIIFLSSLSRYSFCLLAKGCLPPRSRSWSSLACLSCLSLKEVSPVLRATRYFIFLSASPVFVLLLSFILSPSAWNRPKSNLSPCLFYWVRVSLPWVWTNCLCVDSIDFGLALAYTISIYGAYFAFGGGLPLCPRMTRNGSSLLYLFMSRLSFA